MTSAPQLDLRSLRAGMRVAVAVSGGADSVALLRALVGAAPEIGLALSVAHVHHGIRGAEADEDARFVADLAAQLGLVLHLHRGDAPAAAASARQSLEEAARHLRYAWFRDLLAQGKADAVATAHTLDDQAETVLHRLIRGAWTEGLGGIHPVIACAGGSILRPFLEVRRAEIVAWLRAIGQPWREDASNQDARFTRNRIRHQLLPQLAAWNPRIAGQLAHMAVIARDEEAWWQAELARLLPGLLLPGKPVRGGGRAVSTQAGEGSVSVELDRLRPLPPALRRRVLRAAAVQLGCPLNFEQTERLLAMAEPEGSRRQQLAADLRAERTPRELRLLRESPPAQPSPQAAATAALEIPGEAFALGVTVRATPRNGAQPPIPAATLRAPRPGDRARLRYSHSARPIKEVFERAGLNVAADARKLWPLVAWEGRIVWMKDLALEPDPDVPFTVERVDPHDES